ncbi:MAG: hypothetical protein ABSF91_00545 [Bacteroidota bacterium]
MWRRPISDTPLSVLIASFTGKSVSAGVLLEWTVLSDVDNYGFYVER